MPIPSPPTGTVNRAVVAYLDGRRLKGFLFNFSALRETFRLFLDEAARHDSGTDVQIKDLKAIFFVKDFKGNAGDPESVPAELPQHGRKIEVIFKDGEKLAGTTEGYNPQKLGFFVFPTDVRSNNLRVFVVNQNVRQVKML